MASKNQIMISRLKEQMKAKGINARELSRKANVGKSFIYDILSGKSANPTTNKIQAVADVLGVSMQYLMNETSNDNDINDNDYIFINNISIDDIKNDSSKINSDKKLKMSFKRDWIKKTLNTDIDNIRAVKINGDYMSPTLESGDFALIDISKTTPNPPGIYILFGVGFVAKRLEFLNKSSVFITSDNKNYKSYECNLSDVHVIGKVVWFSRAVS